MGGGGYRKPQNREETDKYGWWMDGGAPPNKPKSHKGRAPYEGDYPPPPLPWQVDSENNPKSNFGRDYKEWYDRQAGIEPESK